jgi:hypothetical protein
MTSSGSHRFAELTDPETYASDFSSNLGEAIRPYRQARSNRRNNLTRRRLRAADTILIASDSVHKGTVRAAKGTEKDKLVDDDF